MSSILEALRQLETGGSPPEADGLPPVDERGRSRWPWYLAGACAVAVMVFWFLRPSPPIAVAPAPGPGAELAAVETLPPAAPSAPPARTRPVDPPRARIDGPAAAPAPAAPEERVAARAPAPAAAKPAPVAAAKEPRLDPPAGDDAPSAGVGRAIPRPAGEPTVRISSLSYSPSPTRRVVSLSVNDHPAISVREGETVGGVEVTLIMPDGVYVKHAGNIFAVAR